MSLLGNLDETALAFVDECVALQEILTNLDQISPEKAFDKISHWKMYETTDGISTIVENIPCILQIRPNYLSNLTRFCLYFIDNAKLGTPSSEFGTTLLDWLLTIVSDDLYLNKVCDFILLRSLCEENLFTTREYLPVMSKLYSENYYNQFVLMFFILAPHLKTENEEFYNSVFPILNEMLGNGFIDAELVPAVKAIEKYKKSNWRYVKSGLTNDFHERLISSIKDDNVRILKTFHFEPNMQIPYSIFEPCRILRNEPTLIQIAAFYKAFECFKYLHSIGAKMHNKDSKQHSLSMYIAAGGDSRILHEIQRLNVSFKKTLPYAAAYRNYETIEWIKEKRPKEVGDLNKELRNVIVSSAEYNNFRTFMSCIEMGQNPRNRDRHNMNSLLITTINRFYHFAQFITLFETVDLSCKDSIGLSPLHYAAKNGDCDLIDLFLEDGVKPDIRDNDRMTPLHYAAAEGHVKAIELILSKYPNIDILDNSRRSPLHYACMHDHGPAVSFLLSRGASRSTKDLNGKAPQEYCRDSDVLNIFRQKGSK